MKKILIKNFFSLASVQVMNYVFPLIVLPYLSRVIGANKFGIILLAQAMTFYFLSITLFGFDKYAPREISQFRHDLNRMRYIFWSITWARIFLLVVSLLLYSALVLYFRNFRQELLVFLLSFGFIIGDVLFSVWFFQGIEKMTYIAVFNFFTKLIYLILVFTFVKKQEDYILVPLFFTASHILTGVYAFAVIVFYFKIFPKAVGIKDIFQRYRESFALFLSNISIELYLKLPMFILGVIGTNAQVGYYGAAERIYYALRRIQQSLMQAVYPRISYLAMTQEQPLTLHFVKKIFFFMMLLVIPITFLSFLLAEPIIMIIYGKDFHPAISVFKILSLLFIVIGINDILGSGIMLPFGMFRTYSVNMILASVLSMIFSYIFIPTYKDIGAGLSLLLTQMCIAILMIISLRGSPIHLFKYIKTKC